MTKYKKPVVWVTVLTVITVVFVAIMLISNQKQNEFTVVTSMLCEEVRYDSENGVITVKFFDEKLPQKSLKFSSEMKETFETKWTNTETSELSSINLRADIPLKENELGSFSKNDIFETNDYDEFILIKSFHWGFSAHEITPAHGLVAALAGQTDIKLPAYEVLELYVWKNENEQYQYLLLENTSGNMTADELKSHPQVTQDFEIIKTALSFYDIGLDLSVKCFDENNFSEQDRKDVNDEIINFLENHSEEPAIFTVASSFYKTE